ncbi:hypothetical protein ACSBR2_032830 [Camellia fascicularis]
MKELESICNPIIAKMYRGAVGGDMGGAIDEHGVFSHKSSEDDFDVAGGGVGESACPHSIRGDLSGLLAPVLLPDAATFTDAISVILLYLWLFVTHGSPVSILDVFGLVSSIMVVDFWDCFSWFDLFLGLVLAIF